jgi:hypothetical protein
VAVHGTAQRPGPPGAHPRPPLLPLTRVPVAQPRPRYGQGPHGCPRAPLSQGCRGPSGQVGRIPEQRPIKLAHRVDRALRDDEWRRATP